jgi:putative FmdB family regulatory protein
MPTYEYICKSCGHLFDIVQSMHDDALTECPECGGELRKVFAPPAISFKGSGFYATDHGKKGSKPPTDSKGDSGGKDSASKGDSKKETKVESDTKGSQTKDSDTKKGAST